MGVLSNRIDREELKPGDHIYSWREAFIYAHHGIYVGEGMVIHFTRGGQEIGTGTILDRLFMSSSPTHSAGNSCPKCGDQSDLHGVIPSCLDCFLFGGHLCRFEYGVSLPYFLAQARGGTCTFASSDPPEDVLHRARYLLASRFGVYNVFKNNCEDFAMYCKTGLLVDTNNGVGQSGQAASYFAAVETVPARVGQAVSYWAAVKAVVPAPLRERAASYLAIPLRFSTSFSGLALVGCGAYCVKRVVSDVGVRSDVAKVPVEMLIDSSALDEPANANEVRRPVDPPGLDEPAKANKVTKEKED